VLEQGRVLSHWRRVLFALACGWTALLNQSAPAALVNWDVLTWTPGTLSNSYDVDPSNPGNDVTFTIDGTQPDFTNDQASGVLTPAITSSLAGGLSPVQKSLELAANLRTNSKITMTVMFSPLYTLGVTNVSFSIFDIDLETNKDRISTIYGIALNGSKVAATITFGSAISRTGTGLSQVLTGIAASPDTGPGSGAGTATISFGSTPIKGFAFSWSNSNGAPFYQQIAIGDISFDVVPEINPAVLALLVCGLATQIRGLERPRRTAARR
jgi:hypothetical protein